MVEESDPTSKLAERDAEMEDTCAKHPDSFICFDVSECRPVYLVSARRGGDGWRPQVASRLGDVWCELDVESAELADRDHDGRPEVDLLLRNTAQNYAGTETTWRLIVDAASGQVQFERIIRVPVAFEPADWQTTARVELVDENGDGHPDMAFESAEFSRCDTDDAGWPEPADGDDEDEADRCELQVEKAVLYYDAKLDTWRGRE